MSLLADIDDLEAEAPGSAVPDQYVPDEAPEATVESDEHHSATNPPENRHGSPTVKGGAVDFEEMDIEELNKVTQRFLSGEIPFVDDPPADEPAPEADQTPEPAPASPSTAKTITAPPAEDSDAEPAKARARFSDPTDVAIVALAKEKGISLIEATREYAKEREQSLDDLIEPPATPPAAPAPPEGLPFTTVKEAKARIKELDRASKYAELKEFDSDKAWDLSEEAIELASKLDDIQRYEDAAATAEQERLSATYEQEYTAAETRAKEIFPELAAATAPQTPLYREMVRLDAEAATSNPALYNAPDKFLVLAERAAANLYRQSSSMSVSPQTTTASNLLPPRNPVAKGITAPSTVARAAQETPAPSGLAAKVAALEGLTGQELDDALEEIDAMTRNR
jgi:hypothetical protein